MLAIVYGAETDINNDYMRDTFRGNLHDLSFST
jgi:hypothetical protein